MTSKGPLDERLGVQTALLKLHCQEFASFGVAALTDALRACTSDLQTPATCGPTSNEHWTHWLTYERPLRPQFFAVTDFPRRL